MNLYTIAAEYRADLVKLEALELDEQTFRDTLESLGGELHAKVHSVCAFILNLEAEADAIAEAARAMKTREDARRNRAARLREYVMDVMQATNMEGVKHPEFDVKIVKNPPSLVVTDEGKLKFAPAKFFRTIPEREELDKVALKKAILAGEQVAGATVEQGLRLSIK